MTECNEFSNPTPPTCFGSTPCAICGVPLMNHPRLTPEQRGVEVYYVDGPNGIKVQQFRPKRQESGE